MKCTCCDKEIDNIYLGDYLSGIIFGDASISIDLCKDCSEYISNAIRSAWNRLLFKEL